MRYLVHGGLVNGIRQDLYLEHGRIRRMVACDPQAALPQSDSDADPSLAGSWEIIDARGMLVLPSLVNGHAHSAMTLLRGVAEDMELMPWLQQAIWPREARLTAEDVYWGTRLAALEMLATGTTVCADMYFFPEAQAEAARDSGMRFIISYPLIDGLDESKAEAQRDACERFFSSLPDCGPRSMFTIAGHSVYATAASSWRFLARMCRERGLLLHLHLAETESEDRFCRERTGMSPARYLDALGVLGPWAFAAHCLWLDAADWDLLADRGVTVVHNPASNMKLASGPAFDWEAARSRGIRVMLGTDGAASNNSLDLFSDLKLAGLLQKHHWRDPRRAPVQDLVQAVTSAGHDFFRTGAGRLEEGAAADLVLLDLRKASMTPCHDPLANAVYAGAGAAVDTVFCDGVPLVRHGRIEGAETVLAEARTRAEKLR
ncbi:MAG: amidohydrolase [Spirochaetaceae bacterium]|nr:amidohydrolase [Spirochaetaceae bacterium]